jgi:hypothetical protein
VREPGEAAFEQQLGPALGLELAPQLPRAPRGRRIEGVLAVPAADQPGLAAGRRARVARLELVDERDVPPGAREPPRERGPEGSRSDDRRAGHAAILSCVVEWGCAPAVPDAAPRGRVGASAQAEVIGHSAQGRPIAVTHRGDPNAPTSVLVVGSIHGNETAGHAVIAQLRRMPVPAGVQLWLVRTANPDGVAHGTRQNARGVDLNRNFPRRWRGGGRPFDTYYPGPRPPRSPRPTSCARSCSASTRTSRSGTTSTCAW